MYSQQSIIVKKTHSNSGHCVLTINKYFENQIIDLCENVEELREYYKTSKRLRKFNRRLKNIVEVMHTIKLCPIGHVKGVSKSSEDIQQFIEALTDDQLLINPRGRKILIPCSLPIRQSSRNSGNVSYVHKSCLPKIVNDQYVITDSLGKDHVCNDVFSMHVSKFVGLLRHGLVCKSHKNCKEVFLSRELEEVGLTICRFAQYTCYGGGKGRMPKDRVGECLQHLTRMRFLAMADTRAQFRDKEHLQTRLDELTNDNLLLNVRLGRIFAICPANVRRSLRFAKKYNYRYIKSNERVTSFNGKCFVMDNIGDYYPVFQFYSLRISLMKRLLREIGAKRLCSLFKLDELNGHY